MGLKYSSCSVRSEYCHRMDSLVNQMVKKNLPSLVAEQKNLPAVWETRVRSLGRKIPWRRDGYPLQYSCLENSVDRGERKANVLIRNRCKDQS